MSTRSDEELVLAYEQTTGHKPETRFPDDPDWLYRGRRDEKEALLDRHGFRDEGELPAVIEGQEELFGE